MADLTRVRLQVEELAHYLNRNEVPDVVDEFRQLGQHMDSLEQNAAMVQLEGPESVAGHAQDAIMISANACRALVEWKAYPGESRQQETAAYVQEMYKVASRFEKTARKHL
ncbi:hypothetical protein [Streptomyces sp. NPDC056524]|uniref:hypothetical protein n=1 Tax=Streptomyces sp. NPDC056524 TaxID=3345851 RepID=UPI0036B6789C